MRHYSVEDYNELQRQWEITPQLGDSNGPTGAHWILGAVIKKIFGILCGSREEIMYTADRLLRERYNDRE
jgi:hypothetical protein